MHTGAHGVRPVEYGELAAWLINRARSVGIEHAVEDLRTYLKLSELPGEKTLLVSGLTPQKASELGQGISFIPCEELRESEQK